MSRNYLAMALVTVASVVAAVILPKPEHVVWLMLFITEGTLVWAWTYETLDIRRRAP